MEELLNIIDEIKKLDTNLYQKDFLLTWEKSIAELKQVLCTARVLKNFRETNISAKVFQSGLALSIFRDNSTRTRFSFASAANLLGLEVQDLDEKKSQIAHGETVRETANMISFMTDIIGIRDDMYLGAGNAYMREVGQALDEGFKNGILQTRPGIINLQCDIDHPTQSMADLLHLSQQFGGLDKLAGKKIAMTWAYSPSYGKPLSVPQGIISLMARFGMNVELAYPEGYGLIPEVVDNAHVLASEGKGSFKVVNSMEEAFENADIVYPKSWAPFDVMKTRTHLLQQSDKNGLEKLEKECLAQNAQHKNWECNEAMMERTKKGNALYMHCLPADISGVSCKQGEVSADVFEKYRLNTYREASYKPYIIAAMILNNRFEHVSEILQKLYIDGTPRMN